MSRIGPRMADVQWMVEQSPGHYMVWYADRVGPHGSRKYGYATVHRAIDAGIVDTVATTRGLRLYPIAVQP